MILYIFKLSTAYNFIKKMRLIKHYFNVIEMRDFFFKSYVLAAATITSNRIFREKAIYNPSNQNVVFSLFSFDIHNR